MQIPVVSGKIDRRILANFTADPAIVRRMLPAPFAPKLYNGKAIIGICLIRLRQLRPKGLPSMFGVSSENAAHRFAVEWEENGEYRQGVYIPRRDSSSFFNAVIGGKLFPANLHYTKFNVRESGDDYHISFKNKDGVSLLLDAKKTQTFPATSIFGSLENASSFFEAGATGFSPSGNSYDGLELRTFGWKVESLDVTRVESSFFNDEELFPKGSVVFDNALLMTDLDHEWHQTKAPEQCCAVPG